MASIFGHMVAGVTLANVFGKKVSIRFAVACAVSAVLPDIDVLAFQFDIPYESAFGHRGFTHSILFAFLWGVVITFLLFRQEKKLLIFTGIFLSTLSHGLLDALTTGGLGVGFFIPFDVTRYFFGFRPIQVSPIGVKAFFSEWGIKVISSEMVWVGIPCLVIYILAGTLKRIKK